MIRFIERKAESAYFEKPSDMREALYKILIQRGVTSRREAEEFLRPDIQKLYSPMLLQDMAQAVERIQTAIRNREHICIFGDYDVDGVCASGILGLYLKTRGVDAEIYLPLRHKEGYGLNDAAMRELARRNALMVTVDCGISCAEQIRLAQELGMDCIVTDHHQRGEILPPCPTVNPILGEYPFPLLCGAGVAWKLVCALGGLDAAMEYIDLAALATIADLVSLTGENRILAAEGLKRMNMDMRVGIRALVRAAGMEGKQLTAGHIAFQIAPRLNAGGRLGDARRSLRLLMESDMDSALVQAQALEAENANRREIEQEIHEETEKQLADFDFPAHRIIVLSGEGWNAGVIGLAASRITEKYQYPSILLSIDGDTAVGSCRSIPEVNIFEALCYVQDLFIRFGGHRQAAGLTIPTEKIPELQRRLDEYLWKTIAPTAYIPRAEYDAELPLAQIDEGLVEALEDMQPTGFGNPSPIFRARAKAEEARSVGSDGSHLKLTFAQDGKRVGGICFREGKRAKEVLGRNCEVLFTPKLNAFGNRVSVDMEAKLLVLPPDVGILETILPHESKLQATFLTEMFYNRQHIISHTAVTMRELRKMLQTSPQGTLILTADVRQAERIAEALREEYPDIFAEQYPDDPRAFNAICAYPTGTLPKNYRRIVLAGVSDSPIAGDVCALAEVEMPAWTRQLPEIDDLRDVLRGLLKAAKAGARMSAEDSANISRPGICGAAAILVLRDMGILEIQGDTYALHCEKKVNPTDNMLFQYLQKWKHGVCHG